MILHRGLARGYIVMPSYGQAHILKYLLHTKLFSLYYREGMIFLKLNIVRRSRHLGWWDWGPPGQGESLQSGTERALDESWLLFSHSVMSDSLWPHGLQHTRLPCPSPSPGACSNSCPLSRWCHPTICHPLLLLSSIFPSIRVFYNESALCIRWPKCWSFNFNISPSNEHPGLIYLRMDWLDLLAVQGTLKSLLQHHSSKASIVWHSAFFTSNSLGPHGL